MEWTAFVLGVVSSMTAALVIFLFKNQVANMLNLLFFKVFPKIAGTYKITVADSDRLVLKDQRDILKLSQFGSVVWGINETYEGDKLICKDKIHGKVTASRFLLFDFESITDEHHNLGSGVFRLSSDSAKLTGYITSLCANCQNATSIEAVLTKM